MTGFQPTPRPPSRLFEWVSSLTMVGFVGWPLITGRPIHSSGHEYLVRVGLDLQHISIALGLMGALRIYVLSYHGRFFGWCPWVRAALAGVMALVWTELLTSLVIYAAHEGITSAGMCVYSALLYGELITLHRALSDGMEQVRKARQEREDGRRAA